MVLSVLPRLKIHVFFSIRKPALLAQIARTRCTLTSNIACHSYAHHCQHDQKSFEPHILPTWYVFLFINHVCIQAASKFFGCEGWQAWLSMTKANFLAHPNFRYSPDWHQWDRMNSRCGLSSIVSWGQRGSNPAQRDKPPASLQLPGWWPGRTTAGFRYVGCVLLRSST